MGEEGEGGRRREGKESENSAFAPGLPVCQLQELGQVSTGHALAHPGSAESCHEDSVPGSTELEASASKQQKSQWLLGTSLPVRLLSLCSWSLRLTSGAAGGLTLSYCMREKHSEKRWPHSDRTRGQGEMRCCKGGHLWGCHTIGRHLRKSNPTERNLSEFSRISYKQPQSHIRPYWQEAAAMQQKQPCAWLISSGERKEPQAVPEPAVLGLCSHYGRLLLLPDCIWPPAPPTPSLLKAAAGSAYREKQGFVVPQCQRPQARI